MISSLDGGGSERQALSLLQHLDRARFAPELYLLRRSGSLLSRVPADVPIHSFDAEPSRTHTRWLRWPGSVHRAQVNHLTRLLRQRSIDVIYDRTFHMSLIASPAATACAVPRVSTIVSPPSHAVPLNAGRFLGIKRRRLRKAYRTADSVIAVSKPTAQDAGRYYGLAHSRFSVIPNPVDTETLDALVQQSFRPQRDDRYTIACVGRMSVEKGQRDLLSAFEQWSRYFPDLPPPKFWLIGDGPLRANLERSVDQRNWRDSFQFLGHLEHPEPWIAAADALCLPSHFEGFPNVMLEAMALGVPVIARSLDVTRSLGRIASDRTIRGRDYLATYDDSTEVSGLALARKLHTLKVNSTATRSRVLAARRLARETLSIANIMPRIERKLISAVARTRNPSQER